MPRFSKEKRYIGQVHDGIRAYREGKTKPRIKQRQISTKITPNKSETASAFLFFKGANLIDVDSFPSLARTGFEHAVKLLDSI